jgi:hypothetical protein
MPAPPRCGAGQRIDCASDVVCWYAGTVKLSCSAASNQGIGWRVEENYFHFAIIHRGRAGERCIAVPPVALAD